MTFRDQKRAHSFGEISLSVQQHCLHPCMALAPESSALGKAPLCRTPVSSPSPCGEVVASARTTPGTEDTRLSLQAEPINRAICALWLSLLAAVTPFLGGCAVMSPHIPPFGEQAGLGSRGVGKEILSEPLGRTTNLDKHKKKNKKYKIKKPCKCDSQFPGGSFFFLKPQSRGKGEIFLEGRRQSCVREQRLYLRAQQCRASCCAGRHSPASALCLRESPNKG